MRRLAILALLLAVGACTRKPVPAPVVVAAKFPDFIRPTVPPSLRDTPPASNQERGWTFLQAGDLRLAEREFDMALKTSASFFPAENGLGYVELARKDPRAALPHFDRALARQPADLSGLMGKAQALFALDRDIEALPVLEAALAVDPSLTEMARRVEVLRFRVQQDELNRARQAGAAGRFDEAASLYKKAIANSPDSAFLYRELAAIERRQAHDAEALEHLRKAVALEPGDAKSLVQIGDILEARGAIEEAMKAYTDALLAEPSLEVEAKLDEVRARTAAARLPEQYRAIERAPQITRGDLSALVGQRLSDLLKSGSQREAVLITDVANHWAASWIVTVARAGIMEPYANHAFQPRTIVRRVDLAQVVSRLLMKVSEATPNQRHPWQSARLKFPDLAPGHLAYLAASAAVASGVMAAGANSSFQPTRLVSGQDAIQALDRIASLARGDSARGKSGR